MKASRGFNVRSFSLSQGQEGQHVLRLYSDRAGKNARGFEIKMTREECQHLQQALARHLGTDAEILRVAIHGFGAGLGAALGQRILIPKSESLKAVKHEP